MLLCILHECEHNVILCQLLDSKPVQPFTSTDSALFRIHQYSVSTSILHYAVSLVPDHSYFAFNITVHAEWVGKWLNRDAFM